MIEITSEILAKWKADADSGFSIPVDRFVALIAEVERRRNELLVLTGVPDENKRLRVEVERLRAETDQLNKQLLDHSADNLRLSMMLKTETDLRKQRDTEIGYLRNGDAQ